MIVTESTLKIQKYPQIPQLPNRKQLEYSALRNVKQFLNLFVKVQILAGLPGGNSFKINALGLILG